MTTTTIYFDNPINSSLQIGDILYHAKNLAGGITTAPIRAGVIIAKSDSYITIEGDLGFTDNVYFLFAKDARVEETSLKGYWADVQFANESNKRVELFAISSEITPSSK